MLRSLSPAVIVAGASLFLFPAASFALPTCDSIETRKAVLDFIASDGSNRLANFAAKNNSASGKSKTASKSLKSKSPESEAPFYALGQSFVTTGTTKDKLTVKCSGALSASVGDTKATKEIEFTVQQARTANSPFPSSRSNSEKSLRPRLRPAWWNPMVMVPEHSFSGTHKPFFSSSMPFGPADASFAQSYNRYSDRHENHDDVLDRALEALAAKLFEK